MTAIFSFAILKNLASFLIKCMTYIHETWHRMTLTYISWSNDSLVASALAFSSSSILAYDLQSSNLAYHSSITETETMWYHSVALAYILQSTDFVIVYMNF